MSERIEISDAVYRALLREKGDRTVNEVLEELLEDGRRLEDVTGQGVLDAETAADVTATIEQSSTGVLSRSEDEPNHDE